MEKVKLVGDDYTLPSNLCVSCSALSSPDTFITTKYGGRDLLLFDLIPITFSRAREFSFLACQHCAKLYRG